MSVLVLITSEFDLSPGLEADWLAQLPLPRRIEVGRWQDGRARRRSLLGSRLLAEGLHRLGCGSSGLATLRYPPLSRPVLDLPVEFSLSHCDGRIVCALSTCGPVGIDVEARGGLTAAEFHLYLSAPERAWAGLSSQRFYSVWTRKEAVVKAAGTRGLRDLARVETDSAALSASFEGRIWRTPPVRVGRGHVAHLALADAPGEVTVSRLGRRVLDRDAQPTARHAMFALSGAVL